MRAVPNCSPSHSSQLGAQMPTRSPRLMPSASSPAATSSALRCRSYQDQRVPVAAKIAASRAPCAAAASSSSAGMVMKRSGSSAGPAT